MSAKGPSDPTITRKLLLELYYGNQDTSLDEVAKQLSVSREAVRKWCKHFDIPLKPRSRKGGKRVKHPQLLDRVWLEEQLRTKTQVDIAQVLGAKEAAVNYWVRQHGLADGDKSEIIRKALRKRYPSGRNAEQASNWRGGHRIVNGYVAVYAPDHPAAHNGVVFEHRLVAEKELGRLLEPKEVVHHVDGDPLNNRPDNLVVKQRGQHVSEHFQASHEVKAWRSFAEDLLHRVEILEVQVKELEAQLDRNEGRRC